MTVEQDLNELLGAWAASVRVADAEADAMCLAIVGVPRPGLSPSWWKGFTAQLSDVMVRANQAGRGALVSV